MSSVNSKLQLWASLPSNSASALVRFHVLAITLCILKGFTVPQGDKMPDTSTKLVYVQVLCEPPSCCHRELPICKCKWFWSRAQFARQSRLRNMFNHKCTTGYISPQSLVTSGMLITLGWTVVRSCMLVERAMEVCACLLEQYMLSCRKNTMDSFITPHQYASLPAHSEDTRRHQKTPHSYSTWAATSFAFLPFAPNFTSQVF